MCIKSVGSRLGIRLWLGIGICLIVSIDGCRAQQVPGEGDESAGYPEKKVNSSVTIELTSSDFAAGGPIPRDCTGEGDDRSPQLQWKNTPHSTKQLALICDDPDAPTEHPWVHWVIYGIAPTVQSLPVGIPSTATLVKPIQAKQGRNSWHDGRTIGYRGPMPPPGHGVHHYHFKLYALTATLDLPPGADKYQLLKAIDDHIAGQGELIGTYQR